MKPGVAGCGQMGRPMAEALRAAGYDARGFDIRPPAAFGDFAPYMTGDAGAFAADRDVIVTVVRDVPQTETLLFGPAGLLARAPKLEVLVISSTLSPRYLATLPARVPAGIALVDAPMSGAPVAAWERRLSFMLGGPADVLDGLMPLFAAMGTRHHRLGAFGAGMTAKVLNNLVAASSVAATRLALDWARPLGVDRDALLAVLDTSSGQTWFGSNFERIVFAREGFDAGNTIGILNKDLESLLDAAPEGADKALPEALIEAISRLNALD